MGSQFYDQVAQGAASQTAAGSQMLTDWFVMLGIGIVAACVLGWWVTRD